MRSTEANNWPTTSPSGTGPGPRGAAREYHRGAAGGPARNQPEPAERHEVGRSLGPAGAVAAGPDLHDRRDAAAVRRHADHLVHGLERVLPRRARVRRV